MEREFSRTIGIIGGVGPAATSYALQRLIALAQACHGAHEDTDFPDVFLTSIPIEGMDSQGFDPSIEESVREQLTRNFSIAKTAGADLVYMACNTLHGYKDVIESSGLEEVDMVDETARFLADRYPASRVSVLSSAATRREGLYRDALEDKGLQYRDISDADQALVDSLIYGAMGGKELEAKKQNLRMLSEMVLGRSDIVVLGCTELSLVADQRNIIVDNVLDSQEVAIRELLRRAR